MEELKNNELDLGVVLYEVSNAKSIYDAPTGKVGAKGWAQRIYMMLLGAGLLGWFVYCLVVSISQDGPMKAIVDHIASFFVLIIAELILMLTGFNAWGKFTRGVLKHKGLTRQHGIEGVRTRQLEEEFKAADANKDKENALRIYRDHVVIVNKGHTITIARSELRNVHCDATPKGYKLTFELYDDKKYMPYILVPLEDLPRVKKHFDSFDETPVYREKGYLRKKLPMVAFMLIPTLVGVALIVVRHFVLPDMPLIFGLVFTVVGFMLIIAQFSDFSFIQYGLMPVGFGLILTGLPIGVAYTIVDLAKEITLIDLLSMFTPIHAGMGLFFGLGPMLIIVGIAGIVDCLRMRHY